MFVIAFTGGLCGAYFGALRFKQTWLKNIIGRQAAYARTGSMSNSCPPRRRLEQRPLLAGQPGRPQQHGLPDAVGTRRRSRRRRAGPGPVPPRRRDSLGPAGHRRGQGRPGLRPSRWASIRVTPRRQADRRRSRRAGGSAAAGRGRRGGGGRAEARRCGNSRPA